MLRVPGSLVRDTTLRGIGSPVHSYRSPDLLLWLRYSSMDRPPANEGQPGYRRERVRVDGREGEYWVFGTPPDAENQEFAYRSGIYVPVAKGATIGPATAPDTAALLMADCKTAADCEVARRIFFSLRFTR